MAESKDNATALLDGQVAEILSIHPSPAPSVSVDGPQPYPVTTDARKPWGSPQRTEPGSIVEYVLKRFLDLAGSALLLVVLSPVMLAIAIAIKATSPGPVLYRSPRLGLGGRRFECLKFRTMSDNAEEQQEALESRNEAAGPIFKIADDPRVTRIGHFLRATALDELPQLLNVLRSEMSLVGPRPLPLRDCERLTALEHRRHTVRPGLTGMWQVAPERHDPTGAPIVAIDLDYIDRWSLWLDVMVVLKTFAVIIRKEADSSTHHASSK
jgi:lipopolysaccharide/colanic/teichoic acid biosynthesis glycosyltransferase